MPGGTVSAPFSHSLTSPQCHSVQLGARQAERQRQRLPLEACRAIEPAKKLGEPRLAVRRSEVGGGGGGGGGEQRLQRGDERIKEDLNHGRGA